MIRCQLNCVDNTTITLHQGEDYSIPLNFYDGDNDALDISGSTNTFIAKKHLSSSTNIIDIDAVISNAVGGKAIVQITKAALAGLRGPYYFSIRHKNSAGVPVIVAKGYIVVELDSTAGEA